jgi:multiple sugar transport system permease protein
MSAATRRRSETLSGLLWTSPWLIGSLVFMFLPMGMSLWYSFTDYPLIEPPIFAGLDNYTRLLDDPTFHRVVKNTVLYAALAVPGCTIFGLAVAGMLHGLGRIGRLYRACIFVPTLVPLVAVATVWMWLFNGEYGLINQVLALLGIRGPAWIVDTTWVLPSMILMSLWGVGQSVVIYGAALDEIPRPLLEAARLDGMSAVQRFRYVCLPLISPAILFNVIVMTINAVQVFAVPYVMFRRPDGQNPAGHFYTMYLYENAFVYAQMGYACAMAWLQLVVVLVLTGVLFLASRRLVYYRGA